MVVEGANDYEFLLRLANRLNQEVPTIANLGKLATTGRIIILPAGGGNPAVWAERLAPLGLPQFHLFDREQEPQTTQRIQAIKIVNAFHGCRAVLLSKRSLENYLHPAAISAAGGGELTYGDQDLVARLVAQQRFAASVSSVTWESLKPRAQQRLTHRAKHLLNRQAVEHMTLTLLAERDPAGELLDCLQTIATLANS